MNQRQFYNTPEVIEAINIQKANPYGSKAHKDAHAAIGKAARKYGVWAEYVAANGSSY